MNLLEIEELFERLRKAGQGFAIKLDAPEKGHIVEGVIFEPVPARPAGYEAGIFVKVPSDNSKVYYLDPEASKQHGKIIMKMMELKKEKPTLKAIPTDFLKEYEHVRQSPDVKLGGGAVGEAKSKATGTIALE